MEVDKVEGGARSVREQVLSLRCLSQNAKAGFLLLVCLTGSSMVARSYWLFDAGSSSSRERDVAWLEPAQALNWCDSDATTESECVGEEGATLTWVWVASEEVLYGSRWC